VSVKWRKKAPAAPRIIAAIVVLGLVGLFSRRSTSDAALARHFQQNRSAFVELKSMLATNSPGDPANGTESIWSMEHYQRYRQLIHQARVLRIVKDNDDLRFQLVGPLAPGKNCRIAVTWTESKPDNLVGSISEFRKTTRQLDHAYQPLGDNWYLWVSQ
jgi:hypothetical protein